MSTTAAAAETEVTQNGINGSYLTELDVAKILANK